MLHANLAVSERRAVAAQNGAGRSESALTATVRAVGAVVRAEGGLQTEPHGSATCAANPGLFGCSCSFPWSLCPGRGTLAAPLVPDRQQAVAARVIVTRPRHTAAARG